MYTLIVTPVHGEQVMRQYEFFSEAYAAIEQLTIAFFADENLKAVEMRYSDEKI